MLLLIFVFLILGFTIGYYNKKDSLLYIYSDKIATITVYLLLFLMGISTAQIEGFFEMFSSSGRSAFALAILGILGSILFTLPINNIMKKRRGISKTFLSVKHNPQIDTSDKKEIEINKNNFELRTNTEVEKPKSTKSLLIELSIPIICYFIGVFVALYIISTEIEIDNLVYYTLYAMIFFTGISISKMSVIDLIKRYHVMILFIPILSLLGSFLGAIIYSTFSDTLNMRECLSINAAMGWYSLSAILNKTLYGDMVGLIAFLANFMREIITILFCQIFVKIFGSVAPIASGGSTTTDVTLPFIKKATNSEFALIAFINGAVLTILVPPVTTIINIVARGGQ